MLKINILLIPIIGPGLYEANFSVIRPTSHKDTYVYKEFRVMSHTWYNIVSAWLLDVRISTC